VLLCSLIPSPLSAAIMFHSPPTSYMHWTAGAGDCAWRGYCGREFRAEGGAHSVGAL
jgi:hypothetical protein